MQPQYPPAAGERRHVSGLCRPTGAEPGCHPCAEGSVGSCLFAEAGSGRASQDASCAGTVRRVFLKPPFRGSSLALYDVGSFLPLVTTAICDPVTLCAVHRALICKALRRPLEDGAKPSCYHLLGAGRVSGPEVPTKHYYRASGSAPGRSCSPWGQCQSLSPWGVEGGNPALFKAVRSAGDQASEHIDTGMDSVTPSSRGGRGAPPEAHRPPGATHRWPHLSPPASRLHSKPTLKT